MPAPIQPARDVDRETCEAYHFLRVLMANGPTLVQESFEHSQASNCNLRLVDKVFPLSAPYEEGGGFALLNLFTPEVTSVGAEC
jgi:hypothetical protein